MKKLFFGALTAALLLFAVGKTYAQYVPASSPDQFWYIDTGYIHGINSAMIEFTDTSTTTDTNWLMVEAYYGNNMSGGLAFTDKYYNTTYHWDYGDPANPYNTYITGSPDIIVGNSASNPGTEFLVAAAYIELNPLGFPLFKYRMDYYTVSYTGPGTFNVTHTGGTDWLGGMTAISQITPYTIHLDIIAESGNLQRTGRPWCDKFIVTWDNLNNGRAYAYAGSLNSPPTTITNTTPGVTVIAGGGATRPDVAGIQRTACLGCAIEDYGLFSYTSSNMTTLDYAEWNTNTGILATTAPWYSTTYIDWPRIDAPDDYNINSPGAGNSHFKVCAQLNGTATATFDPLLGSGIAQDITFPATTPTGVTSTGIHSIAFGSNNQTQYTVAGESDDASGVRDIYMVPIDWTNPLAIATAPAGTNNWFQVNFTPLNFMNGAFLTAISTPCNNPSASTLVSWSSHDQQTNMSTVSRKVTDYTPAGAGYAFKGTPRLPQTAENAATFGLHPNPAASSISLSAGLPTGNYAIADMMGRTLLTGAVNGTKQTIDISTLPSGNYILKAGGNTGKFVKQ